MKNISLFLAFIALFTVGAVAQSVTSVAGLIPMEGSGRVVYNFNEGWRFFLGDAEGASKADFDDSNWQIVNVPHGLRLEPSNASGCKNYQGIAWYRKHFVVPADMAGKRVVVHFEAIMGKQKVYVNGNFVTEHFGGYLPIRVDLTALGVKAGDKCVIAVLADNSDDKTYPPGKKQNALDFAYHGGMYRDVWLIGTSTTMAISDVFESNTTAGGGIFVHYDNITDKKADVYVDVELENYSQKAPRQKIVLETIIRDKDGKIVSRQSQSVAAKAGGKSVVKSKHAVKTPNLWSPENPYLYNLELSVKEGNSKIDGGKIRIGIRKAEFRGKDGFWLNGKPYHQLIGGNRHQDFAYVGNALPNSQQWRDAKRLKDAGMDIVRAAHYPQDAAFMDACDELGLFIIVPTPGWQFWNKDSLFVERVYQNTREIVRRDRNHACVLMWEPILNETRFPADFAVKSLEITREEYPFVGRPVCAADMNSAGVKDNYDVIYGWPTDVEKNLTDKCIFTREWGEMVDDWYAHNAINRASRSWGEKPMLIAALSLADTYGTLYSAGRQFIGGCLWHPFDHQRGYHPDAYVGGIFDAFRQPKYAYNMFRSQVSADKSAPYIYIANEMMPFSDNDVVVFTNCDSIRMVMFGGDKEQTLRVEHAANSLPNAPVVFEGFWDFWKARSHSYGKRKWQDVSLVAEGYIGGKKVCEEKKMPSRRSTKIRLYADEMGKQLVADGSDFIVVVAEVTDDNGNVRRLAIDEVEFEVSGEGRLVSSERALSNPRKVEWGSAPALIQSTNKPGKITIIAHPYVQGTHTPTADTLTIESVAPEFKSCHIDEVSLNYKYESITNGAAQKQMSEAEKNATLREVEEQQKEFGIQ
ncbi:MAG: glycoside hydrolase family 2 [Bacteroidales bacterium]|jgi:beta-galactosidase|nr:glycoside hydrolase family 2 [Bacteroidales bacterium]